MSSRNQRNFLQLSIATIFLFQFFLFFSPSTATSLLNSIRLNPDASPAVRYELKITAVHNEPLAKPIFISKDWNNLGIKEYGAAQLLIDELARALSSNDLDTAKEIYVELSTDHIDNLDVSNFEIQRIQSARVPVRTNAHHLENEVLEFWTSDLLETKRDQPKVK